MLFRVNLLAVYFLAIAQLLLPELLFCRQVEPGSLSFSRTFKK
jgi:hypothetical protein